MSSQGPNYPGSASGTTNAVGGGSQNWLGPGGGTDNTSVLNGIKAANDGNSDACPTFTINITTNDLIGQTYGFSIPGGATINGILLEVGYSSTVGQATEGNVRLLKAGSVAGNDKSTSATLPSSQVTVSYGGSSDLWGTTWAPSDINASGFGALVNYNLGTLGSGANAIVDFIRITVFYTVPAPTVTGCTPSSGPTAGGTSITNLAGTGFQTGATVTFGGTAATSVTVVSATKITCTTPAHAAGAVNIVVTNPDSQTGTLSNGFTFISPPTVSSVSPNNGTQAGGTPVTVTGSNFVATPTSITFGGNAATSVVFVNSTTLTCVTPAHAPGAVNVVVTNPDGQTGTGTNVYTYNAAPTVSSVAPSSGVSIGGTPVTITGTGFIATPTSITFGGNAATSIVFVNSTTLTCTTPAHAAGAVNVVVTNPDGQTGTGTNVYTYVSSPSGSQHVVTEPFFLRAGQSYTLSAYIDGTNVTVGTPGVAVYDQGLTTQIAVATQAIGVNGRVSTTFVHPTGFPLVVVLFDTFNCTVTSTKTLTFSDAQLELSPALSSYSPSLANWMPLIIPAAASQLGEMQVNLAAWEPGSGIWSITDVQPSVSSGTTEATEMWLQNNPFPNDQAATIQLTATDLTANDSVGVCARMSTSGGGNYYLVEAGRAASFGVLRLWKKVAGTLTNLAIDTGGPIPQIGDVVGISAIGTTISATLNGAIRVQVTDSSLASGQPGIRGFQASTGATALTRFTNFQAFDATQSTINLVPFSMRIPGFKDLPLNSGSIPGLTPDTLYFTFYDDPGFIGDVNGPLIYQATLVKETALNYAGRFFVGSIKTPKPLGVDTKGSGDGGAGAQTGLTDLIYPSVATPTTQGTGTVSNPLNAIDTDDTTFAAISLTSNGVSNAFLDISGFPTIAHRFQSLTLKVLWAVVVDTYSFAVPPPTLVYAQIQAILTPGPGATIIANIGNNTPLLTAPAFASFPLPITTNLTSLKVHCVVTDQNQASSVIQLNIYSVFVEAVY